MKRHSIFALAAVVLLAVLTDSIRAGTYSGGTGEPNTPYRIATPNDLNDIGETTDVADQHPEIVGHLLGLAEMARADIGDYNRIGQNARFFDSQPARPDAAKWKNM